MKLMLLILGTLLLVQLAHPVPLVDSSSSSSSSEEQNALRDRFFKETFNQLFVYFTDTLKGVSTVFQNVITEAAHVENQSEELQKQLAGFTKFIDDVKEITDDENKLDQFAGIVALVEEMTKISADYEKTCRDHPEVFPENLFLDKNGLIEFKKKSAAHFLEFQNKFRETSDAYYARLTPEQVRKDPTLSDWCSRYKNVDDLEGKTELMLKFMNVDD